MSAGAVERPLEVTIAGGGPKAMYCLERLLTHRAEGAGGDRALRVRVYEPTGEPGSGAVYRSGQPEHLRMNFADTLIDAWCADGSVVPAERRETLSAWLERTGAGDGTGYSPRATVGAYLADCWGAICEAAPAGVSVEVRPRAVERLVPLEPSGAGAGDGRRWRVTDAAGGAEACDEVLLAVGHRRPRDGDGGPRPVRYPLSEVLEPDDPAPGEPIAIRGMALTFIDAVLELTEGRGGRFLVTDAPGGLRYQPSGSEPGPITATSRSGRPMLVKPQPGVVAPVEALAPIHERGQAQVGELPSEGFAPALIALLAEHSAALLEAVPGGNADAPARIAAALTERLAPGPAPDPGAARFELERSLEVAEGVGVPDLGWALGESWRGLYPAIVERAGHGGIGPEDWAGFATLARELERIGFGPPPINGAKLLALLGAGQVRFAAAGDAVDARLALDAVTAAPGAAERHEDLVDALLDAGWIRRAPGRRGIEVDETLTCIGSAGEPTPGLAAVGRLTEDWVIGNDTLSRTLHPEPDRWARRVLESAA